MKWLWSSVLMVLLVFCAVGCSQAENQRRLELAQQQFEQAQVLVQSVDARLQQAAEAGQSLQELASNLSRDLPQLVDRALADWQIDPRTQVYVQEIVGRVTAQLGPIADGVEDGEEAVQTLRELSSNLQRELANREAILETAIEANANAGDGLETLITGGGGLLAAALGIPGIGVAAARLGQIVGRRQGARVAAEPIARARALDPSFDAYFDDSALGPVMKAAIPTRKRYVLDEIREANRAQPRVPAYVNRPHGTGNGVSSQEVQ